MLRPTQHRHPWVRGRARWTAHAQNKRAFNPKTGQFLHLSGRGETETELWAWRGSGEQFKKLGLPEGVYLMVEIEDGIPKLDEMDRLKYEQEVKSK